MTDAQRVLDAIDELERDEIDVLVDAQMQQVKSGYDYNINQQICPHCDDERHTVPIRQRMREIRSMWHSAISYFEDDPDEEPDRVPEHVKAALDAYRYDEDDSPILCPGSDFIGPVATSRQVEWSRSGQMASGLSVADVFAAQQAWFEEYLAAFGPMWQLPHDPLPEYQFPRNPASSYMRGGPVFSTDDAAWQFAWHTPQPAQFPHTPQVRGGGSSDLLDEARRQFLNDAVTTEPANAEPSRRERRGRHIRTAPMWADDFTRHGRGRR